MNTLLNRLLVTALFACPTLAQAHSGHGLVDGWAHWFAPDHVLPALLAVGALVFFLVGKKDPE